MGQALGVNPNLVSLYAGISGAKLSKNEFILGSGIMIQSTYAHIMSPYIMAFSKPEIGKPHPAPWKSVSGGKALDITAELVLPVTFTPPEDFDRLTTAWWITALLRLKSDCKFAVPVISDTPFADVASGKTEPAFWPIEMDRSLPTDSLRTDDFKLEDLYWLKDHWKRMPLLMNEKVNTALQAYDSVASFKSPTIGLITLWGALERIFCEQPQELSFRLAVYISAFLEERGSARTETFRLVRSLYKERSRIAHGYQTSQISALTNTLQIVKRVLIKIIETDKVPQPAEFDELLLS